MPPTLRFAPLLLAPLVMPLAGQAGIYKCPGPDGGVSYQDIACPAGHLLTPAPPPRPLEVTRSQARALADIGEAQALEHSWEKRQQQGAQEHAQREAQRRHQAESCAALEREASDLEQRARHSTSLRRGLADTARAEELRRKHFSACFVRP